MSLLPTGTVTFLFTDIEGSTRLWEQHPDDMRPALARHDGIMRRSIDAHGGFVFKTVGDAFCAAFATAPEALQAALAAQLALAGAPWETPTPLQVRMGLHTGSAEERDGDYFGPPLNRVARLMAAGHGGQTLLSLAAQELTRDALPALVSLLDLGPHRLKDLGRPETVFQTQHPSLPAGFPPLNSLDNPDLPNNLPQQVTSFIGREAQVTEVKALMAQTRLLTLTGAGGSGKTRLSLQVAADLLDGEGDGVWLVELAGLSDPALVPQAVAGVLGVREAAGRTVQQALVEWLRPKRLLLILDNCEHLVAACASLAADILRHCPNVHLLASSREPLNVAGERTYRVPSLSLPDPKGAQTVENLSQYEAVRLFIERAQAVLPSFSVTDASAPAVAQVCFRLDGIPLALELAAARVRSLSAEEINRRLDQRFRLLTGGARDRLPRQQTLRALIDWSYDLLTDQEKALLCRLSVFASGWTLAAAEAVCSGEPVEDWEVLDLLTALVDKSLVVAEPAGDGTRYRLLETVRQYGGDRLGESGEAESVGDGHLSWCVGLAEEADPQLQGPDQSLWFSLLEAEHDNLRAGLARAGASSADAGLHLAGALGIFWAVRGYLSEGRGHLETALARRGAAGGKREQARALRGVGYLAFIQSDLGAARPALEEALVIFRELGDRRGEAACLNFLGGVAHQQGDLGATRSALEQSLAIFRVTGNRNGEASCLNNLGIVAHHQGDLGAARHYYEVSLGINREVGDRNGESVCLNSLGCLAQVQGDLEASQSLQEQALAIKHETGDRNGEAICLMSLGSVAQDQGHLGAARSHTEQALTIFHALGNRHEEAGCLTQLGIVAREQGGLDEARALFTRSLTLKRQLSDPSSTADTLEEWVALALAEGDTARAVRLAGAAQAGRDLVSHPLSPKQKETHERTLAVARASLEEDGFTAAWDTGRAMTLPEAVEYALGAGVGATPQRQ